jgi:hypothetical protein
MTLYTFIKGLIVIPFNLQEFGFYKMSRKPFQEMKLVGILQKHRMEFHLQEGMGFDSELEHDIIKHFFDESDGNVTRLKIIELDYKAIPSFSFHCFDEKGACHS